MLARLWVSMLARLTRVAERGSKTLRVGPARRLRGPGAGRGGGWAEPPRAGAQPQSPRDRETERRGGEASYPWLDSGRKEAPGMHRDKEGEEGGGA